MPADTALDLLRAHDPAGAETAPATGILDAARERAGRATGPDGGFLDGARERAARRVFPGAALAAVAAVAAVVLAGAPGRPDAAAALREAASHTASAQSGRMVWEKEDGGRLARSVMRWDGGDAAIRTDLGDRVLEYAFVDGRSYERSPDGAWRRFDGPDRPVLSEHANAKLADAGLLALLRKASSVERAAAGDGGQRFTGTVTQEQLADVTRRSGLAWTLVTGPGQAPPGPATIEAGADAEDRIVAVTVTQRRGDEVQRMTTRFEALGEPQAITAPTAGTAAPRGRAGARSAPRR